MPVSLRHPRLSRGCYDAFPLLSVAKKLISSSALLSDVTCVLLLSPGEEGRHFFLAHLLVGQGGMGFRISVQTHRSSMYVLL